MKKYYKIYYYQTVEKVGLNIKYLLKNVEHELEKE